MPAPGSSTRPPATITLKYLPLPAIVGSLRFPALPDRVRRSGQTHATTISRRGRLHEDGAGAVALMAADGGTYRHRPQPSRIVSCGCPSFLLSSPCCPL